MTTDQHFYVYSLSRPDGSVFYIGKGKGKRIIRHEQEARRGTHYNSYLMRTIRKIWRAGEEVRRAKILHTDNEQVAFYFERTLIALYRLAGVRLCNVTEGGGGMAGYHPSDETRAKLSAALRAAKATPEARARISAHRKAYFADPAARARISAATKARWADPEQRAHMSTTLKAATSTPEARARQRAAVKAVTSTPEARAQRSAMRRAVWNDPERRGRSVAHLQRIQADPEIQERRRRNMKITKSGPIYRAKMSQIVKAHWADPEQRARHTASVRAARGSATARTEQSARSKELWADPAYRDKTSAAIQETWKRPAVRTRHAAAMQALSPEARARRATAGKKVWTPDMKERVRTATTARMAAMRASKPAATPKPEPTSRRGVATKQRWSDPEHRTTVAAKIRAAKADPATAAKAPAVRAAYATGKYGYNKLAQEFGLSKSVVYRIVKGESYND